MSAQPGSESPVPVTTHPGTADVGDPRGGAGSLASDLEHAEIPEGWRPREERSLGRPGRPVNRRTPFYIGFTAALGVAVAYVLVKAVADAGEVLALIGVSLFLAVGFSPAVVWLTRRRIPRSLSVLLVILALVGIIALFVLAAVGPVSREVHQLTVDIPKWKRQIEHGRGTLGRLAKRFHLQDEISSGKATKSLVSSSAIGGVVGAGKVILSAAAAVTVVAVLTVYFLATLPSVRALWLRCIPRSRRVRVAALTDEVFSRVGGFVLGNMVTSLVAGVGTTLWIAAFGGPYPILLGLLVALLDLIPVVGSTIGGVIVSLVMLTVSLPVAIATAAFYIGYRLFEDYLLTPRVMRHTVKISPGVTIIATLVGGVLLGFIGALIAIPVAAAIHLLLEEVTFPSIDRK